MDKRDLSKVSTEQLRAELERRGASDRSTAGKDWYFCHIEPDSDDDKYPMVGIVHKRFWRRHHCLHDQHISRFLVLPRGMGEAQESQFDYNGSREDVERELSAHGYQKIESDFWGALFTHICTVGGKKFMVTCACDTPTLRAFFKEHAARNMVFDGLDDYRIWVASFMPADTVFDYYDTNEGGTSAYCMQREVFENLPPYPEGMRD